MNIGDITVAWLGDEGYLVDAQSKFVYLLPPFTLRSGVRVSYTTLPLDVIEILCFDEGQVEGMVVFRPNLLNVFI